MKEERSEMREREEEEEGKSRRQRTVEEEGKRDGKEQGRGDDKY